MSRSLSFLGACIVALCACSKQEPPALPAEPAPAPAATAPVEAPAADLAAESSLALKRGMLSLASEQATFKPCGEDAPLWVVDQTDGVLLETFANEPKPLELYLEAHGERTTVPAGVEAARAYRGAFILEEALYAAPAGESQGCNAPPPAYVVQARGNEPFWSVEVVDGKLIWRQPEEPKELVIEALESSDAEGTVGYSGEAQGHTLELFVEAQSCRDSMSGAYFAYSARATFDGKSLKGCARIGE
jgi:putative lipoprotein